MFKRLFSWWKEDILLKSALEKSALALEKSGEMFAFAFKVLLENEKKVKKIYEMDQEVNALQIEIRKKIMEHLTINPEQDVTASLVLTTIAVDFERIGDIAKNIAELHAMVVGELGASHYRESIDDLRERTNRALQKTKHAFLEADLRKARELMDEFTWIAYQCDEEVKIVAGDESLRVREAVIYSLLFRYVKRVSAHARNFVSSVVNPFHRVGFKPE
jgi:phosphate transport system protein